MVSLENVSSRTVEQMSSPSRISSSTDIFSDKKKIKANSDKTSKSHGKDNKKLRNVEFEFLSANFSTNTMLTADELFFEGKLRPFSPVEQLEELNKITLKPKEKYAEEEEPKESQKEGTRASWFMDEDPSPRPPTCTVLWKELLKLKKQRASPPLPPSSTSPSPSSSSSVVRMESIDEGKEGKWSKEKHVKRIKKGLERTRSGSFRIRPMVNVPICTQSKSTTAMPASMSSLKKINVDR
ncbi:histone-lysine N-methyltransferase SETD1A-like [Thalictrum thalictroides]|uniref:Histone-lysine N-methyltransferase SETD1A-like n=1 Tax=Thalictrum thalictroides TaxID=46969 RepID=A0A7J6WUI7_THATH|nr:histone-lysine N-methyltransferase SETD1A-like [Thalictrum thalictroides]